MRLLFVLIIILGTAASCYSQASRTIYFSSDGKATDKAGAGFYGTVTRDGVDTTLYRVETFTASGRKTAEGSYQARTFPVAWERLHEPGFVDAEKKGLFREYHGNGRLKFEGEFRVGQGEGRHRRWYEGGSLLSEAVLVGGEFEGEITSYFEDGKVNLRYTARGGLIEGEVTEYFPGGGKRARATFSSGKQIGKTSHFDSEGMEISQDQQ